MEKNNKGIEIAFLLVCFAWTFSWICAKYHALESNASLAIFYRFSVALAFMFIIIKFITKDRLTIYRNEIKYLATTGFCNCYLNFVAAYGASRYFASGVVAVFFSGTVIMSEIINSLVVKKPISKPIITGSLLGTLGLVFVLYPSFSIKTSGLAPMLKGLGLLLLMILSVSVGTVAAKINNIKNATPTVTTTFYAMSFGVLFSFLVSAAQGEHLLSILNFSHRYIYSLAYLSIFASVVAFLSMYFLIHEIGPAKTNTTSMVYPVTALMVSSYVEGYNWNIISIGGIMAIVISLYIVLSSNKKTTLVPTSLYD